MIKTYSFGYQDASEQDRSVKWLDAANWRRHITVADLQSATMLSQGVVATRNDTNSPGYNKNFEPAKSVAWEVIRYMEGCDDITKLDPKNWRAAPHRQDDCEVSVLYPIHAMIGCDNVPFANLLVQTINAFFEANRHRFPRHKGWHAEIVHAEGEEPSGAKRPDKPLYNKDKNGEPHPWLRAKSLPGYRIDSKCARILLVVGIGREGVNNPLCGIYGMTYDHASDIEVVQRIVGRQIRGVTHEREDGDARLCVPPAELDTVTIVTHQAFDESIDAKLQNGIDFVVNMHNRLDEMPTISDLTNKRDLEKLTRHDPDTSLSFIDKIRIAAAIGANPDVDDDLIVSHYSRGNEHSERAIADWIDTVRTQPREAVKRLRLNEPLQQIATVLHEDIERDPEDGMLERFLQIKFPHLVKPINEHNRDRLRELYRIDADAVKATTPIMLNADGSHRNISQITRNIAGSIQRDLGRYFDENNKDHKNALYAFVGKAVKVVLGVPDNSSASIGSQWDIPNCHAILERSDVRQEIRGYVVRRLVEAGCLPSLEGLFDRGERAASLAPAGSMAEEKSSVQ